MKVITKDKQVLTLLFLDWNSKRDCLEMVLEDINAETLKCDIGAEIPHDFMLDGDDFINAYNERSVSNG